MSTQEYLEQVLQVIRKCFRPADATGSMPVATVAYLVKQRLGADQTMFGFAKFKDVLRELENQHLIRTGANAKQALALWLDGANAPTSRPQDPIAVATPSFRPLRNPVWFAFISQLPPGRRFLNRVSGEVRIGLQDSLDAEWVEIVPLEASQEKEAAHRFLSAHQLDNVPELQASLSSEKWYIDLPAALAKINPRLVTSWKRERSCRVATVVENWRSINNVPYQLVFEQQLPHKVDRPEPSRIVDLRQCILSAIQHMHTDKLLDFDIPARLLVAEIRPDLLDS